MNFGVVVAAGRSERMGAEVDKAFVSLGSKPVLAYSLIAFERCREIHGVVLVVRKDRVDAARGLAEIFGCSKVKRVVAGGSKRQVSVMRGLQVLPREVKIVAVHDGARPCVTPGLISETIQSARRYGSGVAAVRISDTVKQVDRGTTISRTLDRSKLWAVQTPQTFKLELLLKAFAAVKKKHLTVTDEASAVELIHCRVYLVRASVTNLKITTPDDLALATTYLNMYADHAT